MTSQSYRGRIAPTTSGYLHVGHAQTFKTAMERARESGGTLVLRIEDIDFERCKKKYAEAAVEDLKSIGIQWDEGDDIGGNYAPYTQSLRMNFYVGAFKKLLKSGKIYPCQASRKQIAELSTRQKGPSISWSRKKSFQDNCAETVYVNSFPAHLKNMAF